MSASPGYARSMPESIAIYLRNHEAAARGGVDLFRRTQAGQRGRPWAGELHALRDEVEEDQRTLQDLMRRAGVRPDMLLGLAIRAAERAGRLKPNGSLLRRSPVSDLVELEALLSAVDAKAAGWRALQAAGSVGSQAELGALVARAVEQHRRLEAVHTQAAAEVLLS